MRLAGQVGVGAVGGQVGVGPWQGGALTQADTGSPPCGAALGEKAAKAPATQAGRPLPRSRASSPGQDPALLRLQCPGRAVTACGEAPCASRCLGTCFPLPPALSCLQTFQGEAGAEPLRTPVCCPCVPPAPLLSRIS